MDADIAIIGAGAIGLAIARKLTEEGLSAILLEKEERYGLGVSSRSTETIHAGIYYASNSLKARLCLQGRDMLYEHCEKYKVNHKRTGKIFIAVSKDEVPRLEVTKRQAIENDVNDLCELDAKQLKERAPQLNGIMGLFSPSSGILDSHGFMKSLFTLAKSKGLVFAAGSEVSGADYADGEWHVMVGEREEESISARIVVNAAGLYSTSLSRKIFPDRDVPRLFPVKGSYLRYSGETPVPYIVYPAIVPGLIEERVDAAPDLGGGLRFGPNSENANGLEDFAVSADLVGRMLPTIKRYLPDIDASRLYPDCAGIRPRIYGPSGKVEDFRFEWAPQPGWLDLWGMESPGLTASLAIAEYVHELIKEKGLI